MWDERKQARYDSSTGARIHALALPNVKVYNTDCMNNFGSDILTYEFGHYLSLDHTHYGECQNLDEPAGTPEEKKQPHSATELS